ncbi:MAG: hypothetical protein ACMG57_06010 [Candidatus Dojkabacteria bacterium]
MAENIATKTQARQTRLNDLLNTAQRKTYFVAAVTVLFVIVMLLVGVLPSYSAFTSQAVQNGNRQVAIDALDTKRTTIENLLKEEDTKKTLLSEFNLAFATKDYDQINVLTVAQNLAIKNNVSLLNSTITDIVNTNEIIKKFLVTTQVKAQTVSETLEGGREDLTNYISGLEENVNLFDVTSAVISRKVGKELDQAVPGKEFKVTIQFNFFYYVQNPTP